MSDSPKPNKPRNKPGPKPPPPLVIDTDGPLEAFDKLLGARDIPWPCPDCGGSLVQPPWGKAHGASALWRLLDGELHRTGGSATGNKGARRYKCLACEAIFEMKD